ncbi:uncharacterized protein LOC143196848 [Rhynchophorus ferrugineus]|uniref:uncharacterized protein LOC143196848 n=1 Tax=Rhynchophorus ferrugineus TaxID=354439 RepID=UPI003FCDAE65
MAIKLPVPMFDFDVGLLQSSHIIDMLVAAEVWLDDMCKKIPGFEEPEREMFIKQMRHELTLRAEAGEDIDPKYTNNIVDMPTESSHINNDINEIFDSNDEVGETSQPNNNVGFHVFEGLLVVDIEEDAT